DPKRPVRSLSFGSTGQTPNTGLRTSKFQIRDKGDVLYADMEFFSPGGDMPANEFTQMALVADEGPWITQADSNNRDYSVRSELIGSDLYLVKILKGDKLIGSASMELDQPIDAVIVSEDNKWIAFGSGSDVFFRRT